MAPTEAAVDPLVPNEDRRAALRAAAREKLGVLGESVAGTPPLLGTLRAHDLSLYPLFALSLLTIADSFQGYAFAVLAPEISDTLGLSIGAVAGVLAAKTLAQLVAPLAAAALVERRARRALLSLVAAAVWSVVTLSFGFAASLLALAAILVVDGFTTGGVSALHGPLLMDTYPPAARVRALSAYGAADSLGRVVAPLSVALLAGVLGFTWRGVLLVLGVVSLAMTAASFRLRDPGFGRWDTEAIKRTVRGTKAHVDAPGEVDVDLRFFEIVRRLLLIPTIRRLMAGNAVLGVLLIPYQTFLFFFLEERWDLGPGPRGVFFAALAGVQIPMLAVFGRIGERLFRRHPGSLVRVAAVAIAAFLLCAAAAALVPVFPVSIGLFLLGGALIAVVPTSLRMTEMSIVPARMRAHSSGLAGIFLAAGGFAGALILGGVERRFGTGGSIVSLMVPGLAGAAAVYSAGSLVDADLDRMIDDLIDAEEVEALHASGVTLPMLACRNVDFAYGQVQVLFGVDFTVGEGEMVALLGVNGAGKSTLLRVISGIGLPTGGSIRYTGHDITYLDAERRVRLGISQIPGGRAVFGPLSVVDNMRGFAYSLGGQRRTVDERIDRCFDVFPRLGERRNQRSSDLSGGEQQMLALSKALLIRPRLLLIDELSLGLAPVVVGQLLDMVREINAGGTAVVLVEQSVNIALSLVEHAYFMEKGEIRFDGAAEELMARGDLLRAVFLDGAGKAVDA